MRILGQIQENGIFPSFVQKLIGEPVKPNIDLRSFWTCFGRVSREVVLRDLRGHFWKGRIMWEEEYYTLYSDQEVHILGLRNATPFSFSIFLVK